MAEYYLKRVNSNKIEIAKFDDGASEPLSVYTIKTGDSLTCNCPRWQRQGTKYCRHTEMVKFFLAKGEPNPFVILKD